jgi:hypothetical protein
MGTTATKVSLPTDADVDDFRDAVKGKHSNKFASIPASSLVVYKNRASFEKTRDPENKEEPLKSSDCIHGLGKTLEEALIVVVPGLKSIVS